MKNLAKITIFLAFIFSISSCGKDDSPITPTNKTINGVVQKGPFISGSKVTVTELDKNLSQTGRSYTAFIKNNKGEFELKDIKLASNYVELTVDGFFFNEITGALSSSQITLSAIADVTEQKTVNVNILTHLLKERLKSQVSGGKSFAEANTSSRAELLKVFHIKAASNDATQMDIVKGDESSKILLAISSILLHKKRSEAQLTEFLAKFIDDFKANGKISNAETTKSIAYSSQNLFRKIKTIKDHIISRYAELGQTIAIGNFEHYIDFDGDGLVGDDDKDPTDNFTPVKGMVQVPFFKYGSEIKVTELDENLLPTKRVHTGYFKSKKGGEFELKDFVLTSKYIELSPEGFFFSVITDVTSKKTVNVNILTHLLKERIKNQMSKGKSFEEAEKASLTELLKVFHIKTSLDLAEISVAKSSEGSKILLAISSIIFPHYKTGKWAFPFAKFIDDFKTDGIIQNTEITDDISSRSKKLYRNIQSVKQRIRSLYASYSYHITVGNFEYYIDIDGDGLVGDDDVDNVNNIIFKPIINASAVNKLYFSNEVTLSGITGNVNFSLIPLCLDGYEGCYDDTKYWHESKRNKISEAEYNQLIKEVGVLSETERFVFLKDGAQIEKDGLLYWTASFYLYVNGKRWSEEQVQKLYGGYGAKNFTLKKGDKIKIGINPLHNFQVRKSRIGSFGSCSEQSKVISLAKSEYISCLSKWASGKTVKSRIRLGIATKKEFTVEIK